MSSGKDRDIRPSNTHASRPPAVINRRRAQVCGDGDAPAGGQAQGSQVAAGHVPQPVGDGSGEDVPGEFDGFQVAEAAQLRRAPLNE